MFAIGNYVESDKYGKGIIFAMSTALVYGIRVGFTNGVVHAYDSTGLNELGDQIETIPTKVYVLTQDQYQETDNGDCISDIPLLHGVFTDKTAACRIKDTIPEDAFHAQYGNGEELLKLDEIELNVQLDTD